MNSQFGWMRAKMRFNLFYIGNIQLKEKLSEGESAEGTNGKWQSKKSAPLERWQWSRAPAVIHLLALLSHWYVRTLGQKCNTKSICGAYQNSAYIFSADGRVLLTSSYLSRKHYSSQSDKCSSRLSINTNTMGARQRQPPYWIRIIYDWRIDF